MQILGKYCRSDVIRWIAAVSGWVADDSGIHPQKQIGMAQALLSEELRASVEKHIR